jgi:hypothetical protein
MGVSIKEMVRNGDMKNGGQTWDSLDIPQAYGEVGSQNRRQKLFVAFGDW